MKDRKDINVPIKYSGVSFNDIVGRSYKDAIKNIEETLDYLKEKYPEIKEFRFEYCYSENIPPLRTYGVRKETDEEYEARIKLEKEREELIVKEELEALERLKKKYEKTNLKINSYPNEKE